MILKTTKVINGVEYGHAYSDANLFITLEGDLYQEAIDSLNSGKVYAESSVFIYSPSEELSSDDALAIIIGGQEE